MAAGEGDGLRRVQSILKAIRAPTFPAASWLRQINPTGKISLFPKGKTLLQIRRLTRQEGRIAIVTNAGWDAVDAAASGVKRNGRAGESP